MRELDLALSAIRERGTYRVCEASQGLLDYASNDYLGLSHCPKIRKKLIAALEEGCALGATGSRLLSGQTLEHERVERFLCQTFHSPSALLFSSGYLANLGVTSALAGLDAEFFSDELNHASLIEGMRGAKKCIYRHNNMNHLRELLLRSSAQVKAIVTESVFSMDGDLSPLEDLLGLAREFEAWLVIDEAHATGVFGQRALGRTTGLDSYARIITVHTGGKALGGQGAFVLGEGAFRDLLIQRSRSFIYTTALSPLSCLQLKFALEEILQAPEQGKTLLQESAHFQELLPFGLRPQPVASPIVPILLGGNHRVQRVAEKLRSRGFDVRAIRSPTIPEGTERLRITIKSFHKREVNRELAQTLIEVTHG